MANSMRYLNLYRWECNTLASNKLLEEHREMVPSLKDLVASAIMNNEQLIIVEG